jgi:hypothetical protein
MYLLETKGWGGGGEQRILLFCLMLCRKGGGAGGTEGDDKANRDHVKELYIRI